MNYICDSLTSEDKLSHSWCKFGKFPARTRGRSEHFLRRGTLQICYSNEPEMAAPANLSSHDCS
eukprot:5722563-Amphidinium_carterae.2